MNKELLRLTATALIAGGVAYGVSEANKQTNINTRLDGLDRKVEDVFQRNLITSERINRVGNVVVALSKEKK